MVPSAPNQPPAGSGAGAAETAPDPGVVRDPGAPQVPGASPAADAPSEPGAGRAQRSPFRGFWVAMAAVICAALLVSGLLGYLVIRHRAQQQSLARPSGIPASVSTSLALLMQLSPVPHRPAPGFTLTDQHGRSMPLSSLRGHAVVLEFMDPHCVDICPIVSQEFIDAYRDLGPAASRAVFIAVNVNPYFHGVADVAAYSREHQLASIPSWHFFTGPVPALRAVWLAYGIEVQARGRHTEVAHTSEVFFIDPAGRERYVAAPMADYTAAGKAYLPGGLLADWGRGIALVTRQLTR